MKIFIEKKMNKSKMKISSEKNDIFGLAVTAFCMLFYDIKADDVSDISSGEEKIEELLLRI
jgi:hypothetical protein